MNIIEKLKTSIESATGCHFHYYTGGDLNTIFDNFEEWKWPIAYAVPVENGAVSDVNGRYHERLTMYVYFADLVTENAMEEPLAVEDIIDACKVKAYQWLTAMRNDDNLTLVSVGQSVREFNEFDVITAGYGVQVVIEEIVGYGKCDFE